MLLRHLIVISIAVLTLPLAGGVNAQSSAPGRITGGEKYEIPAWFKDSFLEFAEDAAQAAEADRHALVFIHAPE
jgi:hypothetical protein